jgi:hypothetical protein
MTRELSEILTFTVPLGSEPHRLAQQFCRQQSNHKKAKQVYLNTLAVSAVEFYLHCMGIGTNRSGSSSWNPVMQFLMDVADLEIPSLGKLECRPVLPEVQIVHIPPEVWSDRIGYVAVQLDCSLQAATLLGFTQTAPASSELPISQLRSLADLLEHLRQIRQPEPLKIQVNLSQWFQNLFEAGWQSLETLLEKEQQNLAFGFRSASQLSEASVKGAKLIDLGLQLGSQSIALLVAIAPETDQKVGILVQVHPTGGENYLPFNIRLVLLSESGETLQEVQSRSQDNYIQLKRFRGSSGECFNIQIACGETSVTENFII